MSVFTKSLGLFQYEQGKDDARTFNLDDALNQNWDKIDNAIERTLPGGEIDAALLNKIPTGYIFGTANPDTLVDNGVYRYDRNPGFPEEFSYGQILVLRGSAGDTATQIAFTLYRNVAAIRVGRIANDLFVPTADWTFLATATPPEEFNLPFASSLVARNVININAPTPNTYRKNQFGEVSVCANYQRSGASDDIANGTPVCVLPPGYRPAKPIERESTAYYGGEPHPAAGVIVNTDGTVLLYLTIGVNYRYAKFELSFVAAQ